MSDTRYKNQIVCPHCLKADRNSWEWEPRSQDDWVKTQCGYCEEMFEACRNVSVDYCSRKLQDHSGDEGKKE